MKAAVLNGSRMGDGATDAVHGILLSELAGRGWEAESLPLRDLEISPFFTKIGGEVHHKPRYSRYPR
ncbi:MAG: hypothetical protein HZA60_04590, partial [Deltaproteobacteria bacterium]|nr:hypothetical protein [Deltaproteobacteria bacterium]